MRQRTPCHGFINSTSVPGIRLICRSCPLLCPAIEKLEGLFLAQKLKWLGRSCNAGPNSRQLLTTHLPTLAFLHRIGEPDGIPVFPEDSFDSLAIHLYYVMRQITQKLLDCAVEDRSKHRGGRRGHWPLPQPGVVPRHALPPGVAAR